MRDILLFTEQPMVYEDCKRSILRDVKKADTNQTDGFWSTAKFFWSFDIENETVFENASSPEYIQELTDWAKRIPIKDPFINYMEVHRSIDAKRIIKALLPLYPELYINIDDESDWFGSAQEYLDTEFDY
jgi:hypothetical protein